MEMPDEGTKARLKREITELLYAYPLSDVTQDGIIRVAIRGEAERAKIAFRAVYALGQCAKIEQEKVTYVPLQIDLYLENAANLKDAWLREMPGLLAYPEYASVTFYEADEPEATGYDMTIDTSGRELSDFVLECVGKLKMSAVPVPITGALDLQNVNQKYVNLLNRDAGASFEEARRDRDKEEASDRYRFESSFACTAHMPVRLALFGASKEEAEKNLNHVLALPESERSKDLRYKALILLEHRRWNAYMIAEGYQAPSDDVFCQNAYQVWKTHKSEAEKLHPCICDGGEDPFYLKEHPQLWEEEGAWNREDLDALDRMSLLTHHILNERCKEQEASVLKLLSDLGVESDAFDDYIMLCRRIVLQPLTKEDLLYRQLYAEALIIEEGKYADTIREIGSKLSLFLLRNEHKDYSLQDVKIIDALSFDLWHGKKYQTLVIAASGNPLQDVLLAFYTSPQSVIYLWDEKAKNSEEAKAKIRRFYASRELNEPEFIPIDLSNVSEVGSVVSKMVTKLPKVAFPDYVALSCAQGTNEAAIYTFGEIAANKASIALLGTPKNQVVDLRSGETLTVGIEKSVTVREYLELTASRYENEVEGTEVSAEKLRALTELFRKYTVSHRYGKNKTCTWNSLSTLFEASSATKSAETFFGIDVLDEAMEDDRMEGSFTSCMVEHLCFDPEVFEKLGIRRLLFDLEQYRIIGAVSGDPCWEGITFAAPDQTVRQAIRALAKLTKNDLLAAKEVRFRYSADTKDPIIYLDVLAEDIPLFGKDEKEEAKEQKISFLKDMEKAGLIRMISQMPTAQQESAKVTFAYEDLMTMLLFQSQGKIFEQIVAKKIIECKLFSDVQTGVMIAWDENGIWDLKETLKQYFETHEGIGRKFFGQAKDVFRAGGRRTVENEMDLVLMRRMQPIFIECKTGSEVKPEWLYKLATVAGHFKAKPVLFVSFDLDEIKEASVNSLRLAAGLGISLIGRETIFAPERFLAAMRQIADGKTVSVIDET
ncbi:MAG: hypothetical protein IJ744_00415 [Lachnospiraceae bacterium]|nr:hypothetical protein [Lachnospiraceae bacterium]